jgi:stage II sporulation protein D
MVRAEVNLLPASIAWVWARDMGHGPWGLRLLFRSSPADSSTVRTPVDASAPSSAVTQGRLFPIAAALAAVLLVSACAASSRNGRVFVTPPRTPPAPIETVEIRVRITDAQGARVVSMPLDDYVVGAVRAELSPNSLQRDGMDRILDVQAVVSRTYAVANLGRHGAEGFDLCDGTHCQLYRRPLRTEHDHDPAARAVAATRGQVITFGGRPIQAVFHSSCGGHTAAAEDVWTGTAVSYLRPVPDWFCSRGHEAHWEFVADEQQIRRALNADTRTAIGDRLDRIDIVRRDAAGRAARIAIAGTRTPVVRAEEFRRVMAQAFGPKSIQSTWFTVTRRGSQFQFTGVGYGHGVGLCQTGAALRAQAGQTPATILAHYFPGTRVEFVSALASVISRRLLTPPTP